MWQLMEGASLFCKAFSVGGVFIPPVMLRQPPRGPGPPPRVLSLPTLCAALHSELSVSPALSAVKHLHGKQAGGRGSGFRAEIIFT